MFCENCGKELEPGAKFCSSCGMPVPADTPAPAMPAAAPYSQEQGPAAAEAATQAGGQEEISGTRVSENVYCCPDGKYRWIYEFDMVRNPVILFTVWKVLGLSCGIVAVFVMIVSGGISDWLEPDNLKVLCILILCMALLSVISYLILAAAYGWKYMVLFEMDEEGVTHTQMKSQFKKAQAMGWLTVLIGAAAGRPGAAGSGMLAATRSSMRSSFASVRKVKASRAYHTIYVNGLLTRNQVYAEDADFDFVLNFIQAHTGN